MYSRWKEIVWKSAGNNLARQNRMMCANRREFICIARRMSYVSNLKAISTDQQMIEKNITYTHSDSKLLTAQNYWTFLHYYYIWVQTNPNDLEKKSKRKVKKKKKNSSSTSSCLMQASLATRCLPWSQIHVQSAQYAYHVHSIQVICMCVCVSKTM